MMVDHVLKDDWQERAKSAVAVVTLHAVVGYALVSGMGMDMVRSVDAGLKVINITVPKPPEPVVAVQSAKAEEAPASPKNLRAKATQIVAPKPVIDLKIESPVTAASIVGAGNDNNVGAADQPGPGFGNGGEGNGLGGGIVSGPRHLSGAIGRKDIPRAVWKAGNRGNVVAHFTVGVDGRAKNCQIRQSSGHAVLDATTCRLLEQRFRFEPARDARGRAVAGPYGWLQQWWQDGRGPRG
ncbi:MAG: TonB family protein [Sphingorhabdus sp.]